METFDIIVIGSGGGTKLVRPLSARGKKVAIFEKGRMGGTCLNHGCIPSKMLIHAADVAMEVLDSHRFDLFIDGTIDVDFPNLVSRVSETIDRDSDGIAPAYEKDENITLIRAEARFVSDSVVEAGGKQYTAEKIFIATGAKAHVPDIPGLQGTPYLTYKEALRLKKQPKKMIVLGAGYIAVELGYFYAALGTEVDFVVRSSFLRHEDVDVQNEFTEAFQKYWSCHIGQNIERVSYTGGLFTATLTNGTVLEADSLLIATGVVPQTDRLGLENTSIQTTDRGHIVVDEYLKCADKVWAFGDVIGRYLFRHSANFEGEYLQRTLYLDPSNEPIQYPPMPHAVFSNPQIGAVGKTEQELQQEGVEYVVGFNPYKKSAMGMALRSESGFVKLLFARDTKKLLGAHVIGPEASDMVHMLIVLMYKEGTLDDLLGMIYIHPALPEIVRNAARNAKKAFDTAAV